MPTSNIAIPCSNASSLSTGPPWRTAAAKVGMSPSAEGSDRGWAVFFLTTVANLIVNISYHW